MEHTGLGKRQVERTEAWKCHVEKRVGDILKKNVRTTTATIKCQTGFSAGVINNSSAWRENQNRLRSGESDRGVKEVPLTSKILASSRVPAEVDIQESEVVCLSQILEALPQG